MQRLLGWGLAFVCLVTGMPGCGVHDTSISEQSAGVEAASADADSRAAKSPPPLDLAIVTGYDVTVLAAHGKPIGKEKFRVDAIEHWSLNSRGAVSFLATKHSASGGYVASDLYLADAGTVVSLATQRHDGDHSGRRFSRLRAAWLNDDGQVLVSGFREHDQEDTQLFLCDRDQITPCTFSTRHLETARSHPERFGRLGSIPFDSPELYFGPQQQLCFVAWNRQGDEPAAIYAGTTEAVRKILTAENDPSHPLRQFKSFAAIYGANTRGQVLFEASVGQDPHSGHRLFLFTPSEQGGSDRSGGRVQEIARQGGRLLGTKITLADNHGHDVWHMAELSERGDVVMIAETDHSNESSADEDCLFVLRPGKNWSMVAAPDGRLGGVKIPVQRITHPTVNARGQVAFVAAFMSREDYDQNDQRLFRLEPDDKLTDLAHVGQSLKSGERVTSLSGNQLPGTVPLILAGASRGSGRP